MTTASASWETIFVKPATSGVKTGSMALATIKGYTISLNKSGGLYFKHPEGPTKSVNLPTVAGLAIAQALGLEATALMTIGKKAHVIREEIKNATN